MIEEGTWPPDAGGETETPTDEEPENDPLPDRDAGGGENPLPENEPFENPPASPLVIDLDGDGVELVSLADSTAYFDLNVDGFAERTSWVSSDDGLLALDVNGNGQIDDNSELFGNMTGFDNGFLQLAQLDENGDGVINALDASYSSLVIWRDFDQDGVSDNGELVSLADTGIASISLASVAVSETNLDHLVSDRSSVTFTDGTVGVIEDIHFQNDLSDSYALLDDSFEYNQEAVSLPVLWGYGAISSTWVSLSENEALRAEARSLLESLNNGDVVSFHEGFEDFILEWAGVNSNATDSRGAYIDARHLEFLEAVYGTSFDQNGNPNPGHLAAPALEAQYDALIEQLAGRFLAQSTRSEALLTATSYEDIVSVFDSHPLTEFTLLLDAYSPENRELSGDIAPIVEGLINNINDGSLTVENAALTLFLIQNDVNSDSNQFSADVVAAALTAGADPNSDFIIIMENYEDYQVRVGGATDDVLAAEDAATYFIGGDGNDTLTGSQLGNVFFGGIGDDLLTGGDEVDTYIYSLGDGNDIIADWDNNARTDRLILTDVNASDVTFESNGGEDLIITFSNGETITVIDHFTESQDESIEEIEFADGSVMTLADIRNKSVADQKASGSGTVIGSDFAEIYTHALGDGTYTISDWDNNGRTDRLVFSDVNAADVSFASNGGEDLVITLSNGERITVRDHFAEHLDMSIEQIEFANGEVLNFEDIRNKSVADQKGDGANTVIGSDFAETYTHTLGDGTYRISDWDNNSRPDTLIFSDVNSNQLVLSRFGNDLRIILPNGEYILIDRQLGSNDDYYIETFEFADGSTMSAADIAALVVAPETIAGDQIGTDADEAYSHTSGDGSYTITDYDYSRGADSLTFSDLNAADVTVGRIGNNVLLSLSNGEQIALVGQLNEDRRTSIETITFADGTSWTQDDLRNQLVDDMKATGTVVGTENNEAYTHTLGDGSYTITDYDYGRGADSLSFTDVNATDIAVGRSGNNLIFNLANGEQITLVGQLDENRRSSIELVNFADGTTWTQEELRNRMVSDMKAGGTVIGTENDEAYSHTLGDGLYSTTDYDYHRGADSLTFTNIGADDLTLGRDGKNLVVSLTNGEEITINRQLDENTRHSIETFVFEDGTTWNQQAIRNRMVADQKATGTVVGTENNEHYTHSLGDGTYSLADYDYYSGNDTFQFVDVNSTDIVVQRLSSDPNDVVMTLTSSEQITFLDQLHSSNDYGIETFEFADGVTWGRGDLVSAPIVEDEFVFI